MMVSAVCHDGGTVDVCVCLHVLFLTSASLSDVEGHIFPPGESR